MKSQAQLVVFTDLDGTLLDHDTYSWEAARPALETLRRHDIPVVAVSSKTRAELLSLRTNLGNHHPYIVENGAAAYVPRGYFAQLDDAAGGNDEHVISAGPLREALQQVLVRVREEHEFRFQSFAELGDREIARITGLSEAGAARANDRAASEPLLWQDSELALRAFSERLAADGLRCVRGGRFVHVMGLFDKADAVAKLLRLFAARFAGADVVSVALGDGPNDLKMLAAADIAVVVKGQHTHDMPLPSASRVIRTREPGPVGWNEAMLEILDEYLSAGDADHPIDTARTD